MGKQALFVKYHFKQTLILLAVVLMVVVFKVILEDTQIFKIKDRSKIMGVATEINTKQTEDEQTGANIQYQNKVQTIIREYIKARAKFMSPHQEWLFLAKNVKYKLINIDTPQYYKDLHLKLIILLDKEIQAISDSDQEKINILNQEWKAVLDQYFWLNSE